MKNDTERGYALSTAVGSGGCLTHELLREYQANHGLPLARCVASALAVALPAFFTPSTLGVALPPAKSKQDQRQVVQWVHETAVTAYASNAPPATPWKEQLLLAKDVLQLTVGDLARFAGVERPTVYHWLSGSQPRPAKQRRIDAIEHLARSWSRYRLGAIRPYLSRTSGNSPRTLEQLLTNNELDPEAIEEHVKALSGLVSNLEFSSPSKVSLSERVAARGFTRLSDNNASKQRARFVRSTSSGEE